MKNKCDHKNCDIWYSCGERYTSSHKELLAELREWADEERTKLNENFSVLNAEEKLVVFGKMTKLSDLLSFISLKEKEYEK